MVGNGGGNSGGNRGLSCHAEQRGNGCWSGGRVGTVVACGARSGKEAPVFIGQAKVLLELSDRRSIARLCESLSPFATGFRKLAGTKQDVVPRPNDIRDWDCFAGSGRKGSRKV